MKSNLIKVYRWEEDKLQEKEIEKKNYKSMIGWRTEPDEALLNQLENKRYILANLINDVSNRIGDIFKIENCLNEIGSSAEKIEELNPCGLCRSDIEITIEKLNSLLN